MRIIGLILLAGAAMAQAPSNFEIAGSMSALMIDIIYPASDAIFYVDREEPKTDVDWNRLRSQSLITAESANLLMMPGRARDQENWIKFSKMMLNAGRLSFRAAQKKDIEGIRAVNDELYNSCVLCHQQYRANYPKGYSQQQGITPPK